MNVPLPRPRRRGNGRIDGRLIATMGRVIPCRWCRRIWPILLAICMSNSAIQVGEAVSHDDRRSAADVVLIDAVIHTADPQQPTAQALAIRDGRILAVGSREEMLQLQGPQTQVWSVGGRLVTPGFIEGHGHFVGLGQSLQMLDLAVADTWDDIVQQVREAAAQAEPGQWIIGRGWHQEKWSRPPVDGIDGYPSHESLSRVSPENPVLLTHASGHMSFANDYAMKLAGVTGDTLEPPGGEILKVADPETGQIRPIGVFRETAAGLIQRVYQQAEQRQPAQAKRQRWLAAVELATDECLRNGITSFQDAGSSVATVDALKELAESDRLRVRLWLMIRDSNQNLDRHLARLRTVGPESPYLTVRAIKRSIDGALGPHGAWLLQPYNDLPSSIGLNTASVPSVEESARLALREDYQVCVHAIGDRANQEVLNLYERLFQEAFAEHEPAGSDGDWRDWARGKRWRIEHAQHLDPADVPRFQEMGILPAMQGIHCPSDAVYVLQRLGYRRAAQGAYLWRTLIDQGTLIINGSDAPVEKINPVASFYASVARRLPGGPEFFPEQAMTRQEALLSYTLWAAVGAFEEDVKGSLTPGTLADLTIWSQDFMTCPLDEIPATQVMGTVVGGRAAYLADGFSLHKEAPKN